MKKYNTLAKQLLLGGITALLSLSSASAIYTWKWENNNGNSTQRTQISNAMNSATYHYWVHARDVINHEAPVQYNSAVPTADANYLGRVRFGGQRDARVAIHESGHVYGVGTYWKWSSYLLSGNKWKGGGANYRYRTIYGFGTGVNTGSIHFWNYGFNQHWETVERHVDMVRSLRYDMGLSF